MNIHTIILAAGAGSRMKSNKAKVLQRIGGMSMLQRVLKTTEQLNSKSTVVLGHDKEGVLKHLQNIKGSIIRLSNSIGLPLIEKANCWKLFINDACKQAVVDRRIFIHSNPNSERDFIPMKDVYYVAEYFISNNVTAD